MSVAVPHALRAQRRQRAAHGGLADRVAFEHIR